MSALAPVLILHTGDPAPALLARHGSYAEQMRRAAGLAVHDCNIVSAFLGQTPQSPRHYRAALITGSPAMVTDRLPWSEQAAAWLVEAMAIGLPLFGVCYGHQLLSHALGGRVGDNPRGREVGTQEITLLPTAADDAVLDGLPPRFPAQMQHRQSVLLPPPGATILASSALDPCQLLRLGAAQLSTQFHPEFGPAIAHDFLTCDADRFREEGLDLDALDAGIRPTPEAASLLRRFLACYAA